MTVTALLSEFTVAPVIVGAVVSGVNHGTVGVVFQFGVELNAETIAFAPPNMLSKLVTLTTSQLRMS